ncbi:MAG: hypothetical protein LBT75_02045 [Bacilli bacterium]|jgi:hypothetical protein|nr:hypothetical protein [Bacilli bacterium]
MKYLDILKQMRSKRLMNPTNISKQDLEDVVEHLVYMQNARNLQQLRYVIIDHADEAIFKMTNLVSDHKIPLENAPSAYLIIGTLHDVNPNKLLGMDIGIASQIIKEACFEKGYDTITINNVALKELADYVNKPGFYPQNIIAIGVSTMEIKTIVNNKQTGTTKDEHNNHVVYKLDKDTLLMK